jgi:serine/threonine protein kinase/tetratricopeptide (TPR) repeat protein
MTDAIPTIGQVLGHYRIVEEIGVGGMGVVFRARDERLDRDVALKILPKQVQLTEAARQQFRREALSLARITDPHVAMAFDFGQDRGINYLVTEYVPGVTLDAKLAGRPLPEVEVLQLGKQLASGLEAAHKEGVIHRDLKPSNLKVTPDGRLKILDFGLAYMLRTETEVSETAPLTETYADAGTLPYMGPEQVKGHTPDERADLWSAGVVLFEMSTGKHPFGDSSGARLIAAILEQAPVPPHVANSKISEGLERIILRALQKDPKERYQSAGDLRIDLANLATGTAPIYPSRAPSRNWRWPAIIALASVFIVAGAWWLRHHDRPSALEARMMAVLPFESVTNDTATNALGLGLTETVTAGLVRAMEGGNLQLVSTHDLVARAVKTSEQARREFGTDLVLEGSLQQDGARIRITWSLVNPHNHTQIAANTITGNTNDIFRLQDTIFDDVLGKLPQAANGSRQQEAERLEPKPAAYDFYLRGRGYLEDYKNQDNIGSAIAEFQRAIAADQNYAPAYAAMGLAYDTGFQWKNRDRDWVEKAKTACDRALSLTPQLAEGHTCLGNVFLSMGRYEDAVREFQRSLDLDRNSDETLGSLAGAYQKLGNPSAAEDAYRKAISVRPNYWGVYSKFGRFYFDEARYSEAAEMFKKTIQLAPLNYGGYSNLGAIDLLLGEYQEALATLQQSIALRPTFQAYGNLGAACFYMRRYPESAESLQQALKIDPKDWMNWGNLGDTLSQIPARRAEARSAYQKAIELAKARLDVNPRDITILGFTADYYAMLDQERQARDQMDQALKIAPADSDLLFRAAILYNHLGDAEKTVDFLTKSVAAGCSRTLIRDTPDFDKLKNNPHFVALLSGS